ncbi:Ribosomal protein S33 [Chamberlinius hualienensis]
MTSGFYKYAELIKLNSNYAKRMTRLSNRIFGEVARPTTTPSFKMVKILSELPLEQTPEIKRYYPDHPNIHHLMKTLRHHGLFRDEHADFQDEMVRLRALRGKVKWQRSDRKDKKE